MIKWIAVSGSCAAVSMLLLLTYSVPPIDIHVVDSRILSGAVVGFVGYAMFWIIRKWS